MCVFSFSFNFHYPTIITCIDIYCNQNANIASACRAVGVKYHWSPIRVSKLYRPVEAPRMDYHRHSWQILVLLFWFHNFAKWILWSKLLEILSVNRDLKIEVTALFLRKLMTYRTIVWKMVSFWRGFFLLTNHLLLSLSKILKVVPAAVPVYLWISKKYRSELSNNQWLSSHVHLCSETYDNIGSLFISVQYA